MYHVTEPTRAHSTNIWLVYVDHKYIDTVFCKDDCDQEMVRDNLINQDGYPANIDVKKG